MFDDKNVSIMLRKRLAANIRKYRAIKQLTQEQLAEAANSSQQYICLIEKGKVKISLEVTYNIATALNVKIDDLICEP